MVKWKLLHIVCGAKLANKMVILLQVPFATLEHLRSTRRIFIFHVANYSSGFTDGILTI